MLLRAQWFYLNFLLQTEMHLSLIKHKKIHAYISVQTFRKYFLEKIVYRNNPMCKF